MVPVGWPILLRLASEMSKARHCNPAVRSEIAASCAPGRYAIIKNVIRRIMTKDPHQVADGYPFVPVSGFGDGAREVCVGVRFELLSASGVNRGGAQHHVNRVVKPTQRARHHEPFPVFVNITVSAEAAPITRAYWHRRARLMEFTRAIHLWSARRVRKTVVQFY